MKRKLRIGIIDLVTKGPTKALWARVMYANFASIMPQVLGVWCEESDTTSHLYAIRVLRTWSTSFPKMSI